MQKGRSILPGMASLGNEEAIKWSPLKHSQTPSKGTKGSGDIGAELLGMDELLHHFKSMVETICWYFESFSMGFWVVPNGTRNVW